MIFAKSYQIRERYINTDFTSSPRPKSVLLEKRTKSTGLLFGKTPLRTKIQKSEGVRKPSVLNHDK